MVKIDQLANDKRPLREVFIAEAILRGCSEDTADNLFRELPEVIQLIPAIKMGTEEYPEWRYRYGKFFDINGRPGIMFPLSFPLVSELVRVFILAKKHLRVFQFIEWSERIKDESKHFDALLEMLVVSRLPSDSVLHYEKRGSGLRDKSIDWILEVQEMSFCLEVKVRQGQVAQHLEREIEINNKIPYEDIPDIDKLFVGVAPKFKTIDGSNKIQGVVVFLSILVPREPFLKYFSTHHQDKLHFVALVKANGQQVYISARSDEIKVQVLSAFNWIEEGNFFLDES